MNAVWEKEIKTSYPRLTQPIKKEIVIVGGGIAGFLTACRLSEAGHDVALLEANRLFSGTTGHTTAHLDALQTTLYTKLKMRSKKKAKLYYESQVESIKEYEAIINKHAIECDFKKEDSYILSDKLDCKLKKEAKALKSFGADVTLYERGEKFIDKAAIKVPGMASFDPLKFLASLPVNFDIYENTRVTSCDFKRKIVYAGEIEVKAEKIIIATNFPIVNFPGLYFLRMYKSTSYAAAVSRAKKLEGLYQDVSESGYTLRNLDDKAIVGGLDHRTGRLDDDKKYEKLSRKAKIISDNGTITHMWSSNDCITFDALPFVGRYGMRTKDVYVITGFNKYGMANAMTASRLIRNLIDNRPDRYKNLFKPQRITCVFNFFRNFLCVLKNLVLLPLLPSFKCASKLKSGDGAIVMLGAKKRAVYKDENGNLHVLRAYCPHLKCLLTFNKVDKTWDCPCHGSRFDIDGNIISEPAVNNLKKYK